MIDEKGAWFFNTGRSYDAYKRFGCHKMSDGSFSFALWAPHALSVSVVGDFNGWDRQNDKMHRILDTGIWYCVCDNVKEGDCYKFSIENQDYSVHMKADPFAFYTQKRPDNASIATADCKFIWSDEVYLKDRKRYNGKDAPICIYEVHLGSWRKGLLYRQLIDTLIPYVKDMGYTHIELMPIMEHPLDDSWGYQVTGFFSPTSRYGTGYELKMFIDACHQNGIGVILDFVAAHFPKDEHGLARFDGTPLFEHHDFRRSEQRDWGTFMFDYSKPQVRSFMLSCAMYWLCEYHFDGLRVDAVSFMLYHDYCKAPSDVLKNEHGGSENIEAMAFFKELSDIVEKETPGALLIAEESTAFPNVTGDTKKGSLGFHFKWNMGYMHDTLKYMEHDMRGRQHKHEYLTFPMCYAYAERFILPFSHDEVVYGKRSLIGRMQGSYDERFMKLRLLFLYQYTSVGKKLNFMGNEFAQMDEWDFKKSLDWNLLSFPRHEEMKRFSRELNRLYRAYDALYTREDGWHGFSWISVDDRENCTLAYIRHGDHGRSLLCVLNFGDKTLYDYELTLPPDTLAIRLISTNEWQYGGTGSCAFDRLQSGKDGMVKVTVSPLEGCVYELIRQQLCCSKLT